MQIIAKSSEPENSKQANLESWKVNAAINIGFCQIEMRQLEAAMEIFVKLKNSREEIGINSYSIDVGLAFLNSCVGAKKEAEELAEKLYADREDSQLVGTGYKLVFLAATYKNLGETEKAFSLYRFLDRPGRPKPVHHHQSQSSQRYSRTVPRTRRI